MSMALGLLFMGGGATTFSTNDEAVAALVIALYPKFPRSTTDNRHHHQVGNPHSGPSCTRIASSLLMSLPNAAS